jgi:hypothetical protein
MLAYIPEEDDKDKKISTSAQGAPLRQVTTTACPHITLSFIDVSIVFGKFCREQRSVQKYILYHGKMMWLLPMLCPFMVMSTIRQRITLLLMRLSQVMDCSTLNEHFFVFCWNLYNEGTLLVL